MQEDFIHYLWKHKKFDSRDLKTVKEQSITLVAVGEHNLNTGPDFFNAQLKIDEQLWAGNVEIHIKSSDWFVHNHETDSNYDNVILHVVWEHDTEIFRKDNTEIPTLVLKDYVPLTALSSYNRLFNQTQKWINCENDFSQVNDFVIENWLERLYFERLERKALNIGSVLKESTNDWEAVLFKLLAKNFGLKVNGEAFLSLANSFDFTIVRKQHSDLLSLEALFFGQAGLLEDNIEDAYYISLKKEYGFLKQKYGLSNQGVIPLQFFRLRPSNFPTIRLSQLANVYHLHQNLFSKIIEARTMEELYSIFSVAVSSFWDSHYTFGNASKESKKKITKSFIDLLLINTIIPLKYTYAKHQGKLLSEDLIKIIKQIASEKNSIVDKFYELKEVSNSALQSQALIQLKTEYCNKNKCLQCAIGNALISSNYE